MNRMVDKRLFPMTLKNDAQLIYGSLFLIRLLPANLKTIYRLLMS